METYQVVVKATARRVVEIVATSSDEVIDKALSLIRDDEIEWNVEDIEEENAGIDWYFFDFFHTYKEKPNHRMGEIHSPRKEENEKA